MKYTLLHGGISVEGRNWLPSDFDTDAKVVTFAKLYGREYPHLLEFFANADDLRHDTWGGAGVANGKKATGSSSPALSAVLPSGGAADAEKTNP